MKKLAIAAAVAAMLGGTAFAQTTGTTGTGTTGTSTASLPNPTAQPGPDNGQAPATTTATADMPAKGANSFTMGQAATRIADHGYSDVTGLKKDQDGVWRGEASKAGQQVPVWLDYKGNVGQQ